MRYAKRAPFAGVNRALLWRSGAGDLRARRETGALPSGSRYSRCYSGALDAAMILHGARVALGPEAAAELDIEIRGARIHALRKPSKRSNSSQVVDLRGRLILPGLINAHDHLE